MRFVGGAHLHHARSGELHDVGDAERSADLDQLAARHHGFMAFGELGEHEQNRGGVVVDGHGGLGTGRQANQTLAMVVAAAARHRLGVVFQRRIAARYARGGLDCLFRHNAAAQVGVDHDAGGVDDATQRRTCGLKRATRGVGGDRLGIDGYVVVGEDRLPHRIDGIARGLDDDVAR